MNSGASTANDVDVDLGRLFASLKRNWFWIAFFTIVITAIVFLLLLFEPPLYRAETRILIEPRESVYTRPQGAALDERAILDAEGVASQVEVITSTDILGEVVRELDLANHAEFESSPSLLSRLFGSSDSGTTTAENESDIVETDEATVEALRQNLDVYRVENSRVIIIQYSSEDPELAARVPNAIADAYLANMRQAEEQSNASATGWLQPEIVKLREQVREAEERVAGYRARSDLLIGQNNTVLATQQLGELSSELSQVRANRVAAESRAESVREALRNGADFDSLPEIQNSSLIQTLRTQRAQLEAQIAELSSTYLGNHPRIRALRSQLADLDSQIRLEAQRVLDGLQVQVSAARLREAELNAEVNRLKAESARADEEQVELRSLEREATAQRQLLETYLTRFREASARGSGNYLPVDARIFSRAVIPSEPYYPKIKPMTAAAFAGALLFMVIVTLLRELFSGRAMRPAQGSVEPAHQVAMPAAVRDVRPAHPDWIAEPAKAAAIGGIAGFAAASHKEEPAAKEGEHGEIGVKAAAETLIASGVGRAIFVSPEGDEAAASAALVAREVADEGKRVILIDLTASGAVSIPMLESASYSGVTNLLAAEAQFADVIHADLYSACHVIPIGTAERGRAMRAIDRLPIILGSLTSAYDLVVVECGAAEAEAVEPLVGENAQILISAINPDGESVAETERALRDHGFSKPLLVTPDSNVPPSTPESDVA